MKQNVSVQLTSFNLIQTKIPKKSLSSKLY